MQNYIERKKIEWMSCIDENRHQAKLYVHARKRLAQWSSVMLDNRWYAQAEQQPIADAACCAEFVPYAGLSEYFLEYLHRHRRCASLIRPIVALTVPFGCNVC